MLFGRHSFLILCTILLSCGVADAGMSLFCAGWTFIWLLLLPFGVIPDSASLRVLQGLDKSTTGSTWWAILPISVMTAMMLGLEDLATQLEDPFKFIPYGEGRRWMIAGVAGVACRHC